jgi:hypothetical protein
MLAQNSRSITIRVGVIGGGVVVFRFCSGGSIEVGAAAEGSEGAEGAEGDEGAGAGFLVLFRRGWAGGSEAG